MATILIVDDDMDIVNLFRIFLSREGHVAISATDGGACLEKLRQVTPDIILLDIMMAPLDGWETLETIKGNEATKGIPVIMVTGKPLVKEEQKKYGAMYRHYLMKPVRRQELCSTVDSVLKSTR